MCGLKQSYRLNDSGSFFRHCGVFLDLNGSVWMYFSVYGLDDMFWINVTCLATHSCLPDKTQRGIRSKVDFDTDRGLLVFSKDPEGTRSQMEKQLHQTSANFTNIVNHVNHQQISRNSKPRIGKSCEVQTLWLKQYFDDMLDRYRRLRLANTTL